jgi:tetratricopeptide (TPR) repeat protein
MSGEGASLPAGATASDAAPAIRGFFSPPALAELIRDLYMDERTGTLVLGRSGVEKRILLDRGMILAASSTLPDEGLSVLLVERRMMREEEAETLKGLDDAQVAEVAARRGLVTPETLQAVSRDLAQRILTSLFRWEDIEYRFAEGPVTAGLLQANVVASFEMIIHALRSMVGFEPIREAMLRQDRALRLPDQIYLPVDQLTLVPIEGFLLSRIDGQTKVRDVLAQVPPSEEEAAARFLFGLLILGLVNFVPAIAPGPLSCRDLVRGEEEKKRREDRERSEVLDFYRLARQGLPHLILGIDEGAAQDQVKAAYLERKERFQPSRFMKKVQQDLREELQIIEARLLESFLAVRSQKLGAARAAGASTERVVSLDLESLALRKELTKTEKQSFEEEKSRRAEQFFAKARDYFKMGDFFNCIRYCEFATSYSDRNAGVFSLLGQSLQRNPDYRWQKRAESALLRAAELEPFNPSHLVALGHFYRSHGLHAKAKKEYEKTLKLMPTHAEALSSLKELEKEKP